VSFSSAAAVLTSTGLAGFFFAFSRGADSRSRSRAESPSRTARSARTTCSSGVESPSSGRAWPAVSCPPRNISRTSSGRRRRRSALVTVVRALPTRAAISSWERLNFSCRAR